MSTSSLTFDRVPLAARSGILLGGLELGSAAAHAIAGTSLTGASTSSTHVVAAVEPHVLCVSVSGTTIRVCLAQGNVTNVIYQKSHPTGKPKETLDIALRLYDDSHAHNTIAHAVSIADRREWSRVHLEAILPVAEYVPVSPCHAVLRACLGVSFQQHPIVSLGIGSFGPIDLNPASPHFGHITSTPKLAWQDCDVVGHFASLHVPINFNTDVNGAALAEVVWGEHHLRSNLPIRNLVYVTVGTGIGAGVVVDGQAVSGLLHPEAGHFRVPRHPDDSYKGNCFCEGDTRVLTNYGFLFLDEIEEKQRERLDVLFGCYDKKKRQLQYSTGELFLPKQPPPYLVEFTEPNEKGRWAEGSGLYGDQMAQKEEKEEKGRSYNHCVSLRVTPDHEMFVQTGSSAFNRGTNWDKTAGEVSPHHKMTAASLLSPTDFDRIRLLACAENGYHPPDTTRRDAVRAMLGMSRKQFAAFIELLGFWLGDGSMQYQNGRCHGVEFRQLKKTDVAWLQEMLAKAGLDEDDYSHYKHKNKLQQLLIRQPDWCYFFHSEFGDKYEMGQPHEPVAWEVQTKVTTAGEPTPEKKAAWAAADIRWEKGKGRRGAPVWFLYRDVDDKVGRECGACTEPRTLLWAKSKSLLGQKLRRHTKQAHPEAYTRPAPTPSLPSTPLSAASSHRGSFSSDLSISSTASTRASVVLSTAAPQHSGISSPSSAAASSPSLSSRTLAVSAAGSDGRRRSASAAGIDQLSLDSSQAESHRVDTFPSAHNWSLSAAAAEQQNMADSSSSIPPLEADPADAAREEVLNRGELPVDDDDEPMDDEKSVKDEPMDGDEDEKDEDEDREERDDEEEADDEAETDENEQKQPPPSVQPPPVLQPPPAKPTKSVKHWPDWVLPELSAAEMRLLIAGLHRSDGDFKNGKQREIYTSGDEFRDLLMQALLHCGYTATAKLSYRAGTIRGYVFHDQSTVHKTFSVKFFDSLDATEQANYRPIKATVDAWKVSWTDTATRSGRMGSMPLLSCGEGVTRVPYSAQHDGRTWCVNIVHEDHLIIAQRAQRDSSGIVTKQSRPLIVGNCPFHGDCLEGLANAKACADRCEKKPSELHTVDDSHPAWDIEAFYLANLCMTLATIVSPHVIVLGGGVLKRSVLYAKTREQLVKLNNGYLRSERLMPGEIDQYVVSSKFEKEGSGTSAGCVGVLELARRAYEELSEKKKKAML